MPELLQVVLVYNSSNVFGLAKDARILAEALPIVSRSIGKAVGKVKIMDSREPPTPCDICIHLEVPYAVWFPWARVNAILVNSEWWLENKWGGYWDNFDVAIFRDEASMQKVVSNRHPSVDVESIVVPWCNGNFKQESQKNVPSQTTDHSEGFLWVLGGSPNKRAAAEAIIPLWKESYPPLHVYSLEPLTCKDKSSNVFLYDGLKKPEEMKAILRKYPAHICISRAESFGYTAAEAEEVAAYTVLNNIPAYKSVYTNTVATSWLSTTLDENNFADFSDKEAISSQLDEIVANYLATDLVNTRKVRNQMCLERNTRFLLVLGEFLRKATDAFEYREKVPKFMPPLLNIDDCPPISIITPVHNRPKFIDNAFINLLSSDYPRNKIEWIVVDDSDPDLSASDKIIQFSEKFAPGIVTYVPLTRTRSIGYKRNLGVERASHDIILMMDDDDHYPSTSFRRRVAYLTNARKGYDCALCTTIAMYDLLKGISAVNVPPYTLSLAERCSEATLTFRKSFWALKKFPDTSVAEGEGFLDGRTAYVVEMPPQQIIVALTHGNNLSSRKVPDAEPGCFWKFPLPLLQFLHGLVGIKVETTS